MVVNHFKSKGSDCATGNTTFPADPDTGDGQGNCNITRTMAAQDLLTWLATDPTGTGDPDIVIIGDLNAYAKEDPITTLKNGGYTDLINTYHGSSGYSYVFDGQLGYLDHALASTSLVAKVTGADDWHINGVEPISLDYNVENKTPAQQSSFYSSEPYRASDHDPVLIGLFDYDSGDLPAGYGTPRHYVPQTTFLGANARSNDGMSIQSSGNWQPGNPVTLRANVTGGSGWLTCWFDWDLGGAFEADEKSINQAVISGNNDITFNVPADAAVGVGTAITLPVRCRLYESGSEPTALNGGPIGINAASPSGSVIGGEAEDYQWNFGPNAIALADLRALSENHARTWGGVLLALGLLMLFGAAGILRRR